MEWTSLPGDSKAHCSVRTTYLDEEGVFSPGGSASAQCWGCKRGALLQPGAGMWLKLWGPRGQVGRPGMDRRAG